MPVNIVAPERDTPGTSATACAAPIARAPAVESDSSPPARGTQPLDHEEQPRPDYQRDGRHERRAKRGLDRIGVNRARNDNGQRPHGDQPDAPLRRTGAAAEGPRQRRDHVPDVVAEKNQHGRERPDVTGHVERQAERPLGVPAEKRATEDEVRRARHRKELRESLDDAEKRGRKKIHPATSAFHLRAAGLTRAAWSWPAAPG